MTSDSQRIYLTPSDVAGLQAGEIFVSSVPGALGYTWTEQPISVH